MEDLESRLLENLGDIELLKQLSDRLGDESTTKRMKTTESLLKVLEEYHSAGIFKQQNTVTEFLWKIFRQAVECSLQGVNSTEEKFQAAWSLILLKLIKLQIQDTPVHEDRYFLRLVTHLYSNRSFKVLSYLMREYQDIAIDIVKALTALLQQPSAITDNILGVFKSLPHAEKVKSAVFIKEPSEPLLKKRKRVENFDPDIEKQKILVNTESWDYQYRDAIGKLWIAVLYRSLREPDIKIFLKSIPKFGFSQVSEPLLFSDFFLKSYDMGGSLAVLALNGLFILSTQYNLESKLYYTKLYTLLKHRLAEGKPLKPGFLKLVELSVSSHLLPSSLVASFIRLFMKESLRTSTSQVTWNIAFALKCLKTHPALVKMVNNQNISDCYDERESDPQLTRASDSSLWEILLLKKHYNLKIVELVREFEKPVEKIPRISPGEVEMTIPTALPKLMPKEYKEPRLDFD